ncbi:MAG: hypothetical protein IJN67_10135 [Oscillospiraceae bacterium]|nr:hypothetical protein [Oscillospiraceae bacterium]
MKKNWIIFLLSICLIAAALHWLGIGPYSSSAAVLDLKAELESLHGREYTGKAVENGTESMEFVVEPKTWFLTNWNLRNMLGLDYQYECRVIVTTHTEENTTNIRTITYQASDPMGKESIDARAALDLRSKTETTKVI